MVFAKNNLFLYIGAYICIGLATAGFLSAQESSNSSSSNHQDKSLSSLLCAAVNRGDHATLAKLLKSYPELINTTFSRSGDTLLHKAVERNWRKTVRVLLNHGASPALTNKRGQTPLICAALYGFSRIADTLINNDPSLLNCTDNQGRTALMATVVQGHTSTMQLLLSKGADTTLRAKTGTDALGMAYNCRNKKAIDALTSITTTADDQKSPGKEAEMLTCEDASETLTAMQNTIHELLAAEQTEQLEQAASTPVASEEKSEDLSESNKKLHEAVQNNQKREVIRALKRGALINSIVDGKTALHRAIINGYTDLVELLLEYGARLNIPDAEGNYPIDVAKNANAAIVRTLLIHYQLMRTVRNSLEFLGFTQ